MPRLLAATRAAGRKPAKRRASKRKPQRAPRVVFSFDWRDIMLCPPDSLITIEVEA